MKVFCVENLQGRGAVLANAPGKLFLCDKTIENYYLRSNIRNPTIETRVIQCDRMGVNPQLLKGIGEFALNCSTCEMNFF